MSKLGTALAFLAGAALGGVSAWYVAKTRYDELSEQEIDSAKQAFYAREQQLKEEIAALKEHLAKEDEPEEAPKNGFGGQQEPGEGRHQRLRQDGQPGWIFPHLGAPEAGA